MKFFKFILTFALLAVAILYSFGVLFQTKPKGDNSDSYSAYNVQKDIKIISSEPHSVEHPFEREKVRQYLVGRLKELGGVPEVHPYDSVEFRYGGYFDIGNVYCQFDPPKGEAESYILLVAHFDSRFRQTKNLKTVYSFGAADDGYGVSAILELVSEALKYRNSWKQGVKVLFTDSEENNMDGMKQEFENRRDLFENVGLFINIEARGVDGPALLFETSSPNNKIMELYTHAKSPYTYSLTSVVYRLLPNFTDFTVVKDEIPGMNFSTVDDVNSYHVDDDCYANINLSSIQHYGNQIAPILKTYLTSNEYSSIDALKGDDDTIYFTTPLLGLFNFSNGQYTLWCAIAFALFLISMTMHIVAKGATLKGIISKSIIILLVSLLVIGIGEGIAYLLATINDTPFDLVNTRYVAQAKVYQSLYLGLISLCYIVHYLKKRERPLQFKTESLIAANLVLLILSIVLYFVIGENFFFAVPLFMSSLAMILYLFRYFQLLILPILLFITLLGANFIYLLSSAITIGALGVVSFIAFYYIIIIVGLVNCFVNPRNS